MADGIEAAARVDRILDRWGYVDGPDTVRAEIRAALARPAGDAGAMRHAAAEVARRGAVVAYEQMADPRNNRSVAHTYADCMEACGKALDECEAMIRALPLPPATAVEEARDTVIEKAKAWRSNPMGDAASDIGLCVAVNSLLAAEAVERNVGASG